MNLRLNRKGTGRRRAVDKVDGLRAENRTLLTMLGAAGDEVELLRQDVAEAVESEAAAVARLVEVAAEVARLSDECDGLRDELAALKVKFGPQLAAEANANRVDVPPMHRDIDGPVDQATTPIDVRPLWAALGAVTNPGSV